ncbi:hypothetical protein CT19431_MP30134 [Cupriavidus taiwanensis]|nr:hypothetical protein CT19431_MP30134 [Cupriavidus taiwanensis]
MAATADNQQPLGVDRPDSHDVDGQLFAVSAFEAMFEALNLQAGVVRGVLEFGPRL